MYSEWNPDATNIITLATCTGTHSDNVRVNKFTFSGTPTAKTRTGADAERTITDAIKYMGWMSLKNSDHNASGANPAQTKRILKDAIAIRQAADRLIAAGTVTLLGTWSNGIAVGPGAGFVNVAAQLAEEMQPGDYEEMIYRTGASCDMRYRRGAACSVKIGTDRGGYSYEAFTFSQMAPAPMHGPAFVAKPRVRVALATMQTCSPRWVATIARDEADDTITAAIEAITGEEYAPVDATWITTLRVVNNEPVVYHETVNTYGTGYPEGTWTPRVGDTVAITYQHERMTTDRVVNVQRVAADGRTFRGYDRTYDRVRNYDMARVLTIRRLGGEGVDVAAG